MEENYPAFSQPTHVSYNPWSFQVIICYHSFLLGKQYRIRRYLPVFKLLSLVSYMLSEASPAILPTTTQPWISAWALRREDNDLCPIQSRGNMAFLWGKVGAENKVGQVARPYFQMKWKLPVGVGAFFCSGRSGTGRIWLARKSCFLVSLSWTLITESNRCLSLSPSLKESD